MHTHLKHWREKRGLSVRKLGELSGVHYVSIVKMETGRLDPQLSTMLKLCQALRISPDQLLLGVAERSQKGRVSHGTDSAAR
jgi:HTH-type transcriptional regulator, cell division transcriptional repressor